MKLTLGSASCEEEWKDEDLEDLELVSSGTELGEVIVAVAMTCLSALLSGVYRWLVETIKPLPKVCRVPAAGSSETTGAEGTIPAVDERRMTALTNNCCLRIRANRSNAQKCYGARV